MSGKNSQQDKTEFKKFIKDAKTLKEVNLLWNKLNYISDEKQFGVREHVQTPQEFLRNKQGDCEDYAVAKYFTLLEMGVDIKNLHLAAVGLGPNGKISHMILLVKTNNGIYVLDSIRTPAEAAAGIPNNRVIKWEETDYKLYFTFNEKSFTIYNE
jgi:predicted transglutaminase-like cysteine proteinase